MSWPTCRGCGVGFICGGGVANTTEGGCPGGNEGCKRQEVKSTTEEWDAGGIGSEMWSSSELVLMSNKSISSYPSLVVKECVKGCSLEYTLHLKQEEGKLILLF